MHKPTNAIQSMVNKLLTIDCGNASRWSYVPHTSKLETKSFFSFTNTSHINKNDGPVMKQLATSGSSKCQKHSRKPLSDGLA